MTRKKIVVLCVDRDGDLEKKARLRGPIIGKKDNLRAASKLALKDPEDSDVNSIFGALKEYEVLRERYDVEIASLTGHPRLGVEADTRVLEQFDLLLRKFPATGFVLVTDGREDDVVIPLLQSRIPLISKKTIVVKQARGLESTYYTIKEALKDPVFSMIFFGIPGIVLIAFFINPLNLRFIAFILGLYLLLKGTTLDLKIYGWIRDFIKAFSFERISFVFYLTAIFLFIFGLWDGIRNFIFSEQKIFIRFLSSLDVFYPILFTTIILFLVGRIIDLFYMKKAYKLDEYFNYVIATVVVWIILGSATKIFLGVTDLTNFLLNVGISLLLIVLMYFFGFFLDVRERVTKMLLGLPVFNKQGLFLGKVVEVEKERGKIVLETKEGKKKISKGEFRLEGGKVVLSV